MPTDKRLRIVGISSLTAEGFLDLNILEDFDTSANVPSSILPLAPGDVLMSIRGSTPKVSLVEKPLTQSFFPSGNLVVLRPNASQVSSFYLWSFLSDISRNHEHPLLARATTQQLSIRISDLLALPVPLVDLEQQEKIGQAALALRDAVLAQKKALIHGEQAFRAFLSDTFATL